MIASYRVTPRQSRVPGLRNLAKSPFLCETLLMYRCYNIGEPPVRWRFGGEAADQEPIQAGAANAVGQFERISVRTVHKMHTRNGIKLSSKSLF